MRYQERIYIQNAYNGVRNKELNLFSTSSDVCIFKNPSFIVSGATKIDCRASISASTYVVTSESQSLPFTFHFTGNTEYFSGTGVTFKYEIYKYNGNTFSSIPEYKSDSFTFSDLTTGSTLPVQNISVSGLTLDGDYLIKGYYNFPICTNYLGKIGKAYSTFNNIRTNVYGIYNKDEDYYFVAFREAETPNILNLRDNNLGSQALTQSILKQPDPNLSYTFTTSGLVKPSSSIVTLPSQANGDFVITFNGLVLTKNLDYTYSGGVITFPEPIKPDDVITAIYTKGGGNQLKTDVILIQNTILSGGTDNQGDNNVYYNTTTNKYEVYTTISPTQTSSIMLMINGVTLAKNLDFYQSTSNKKRIILEGDLMVGDLISIVYFPSASIYGDLLTSNPKITWDIVRAPQTNDGYFTLEVSTDSNFDTIYYSAITNYVIGKLSYTLPFNVTGNFGTTYYYRIRNDKNYMTICGQYINSYKYSDTITVSIATNSINSY